MLPVSPSIGVLHELAYLEVPLYHCHVTCESAVTSVEPALAVAVIVEPTSTLPEEGLIVTLVTLIEPAAAMRAPVELVKLEEPIFEDTLHLRYLPPKASVSSRVSPVAPAMSVYVPLLVSEHCH